MEWIKRNRTAAAAAAAIAVMGALWAGVPAGTLLLLGLALACPLMMVFMHGGGGHGNHHNSSQDNDDRLWRADHDGHAGGHGQSGADPHAAHRPSDGRPR